MDERSRFYLDLFIDLRSELIYFIMQSLLEKRSKNLHCFLSKRENLSPPSCLFCQQPQRFITETSPCAIGNFHKWLLYKCFISLSLIVI